MRQDGGKWRDRVTVAGPGWVRGQVPQRVGKVVLRVVGGGGHRGGTGDQLTGVGVGEHSAGHARLPVEQQRGPLSGDVQHGGG
jgi:hypothetical protein